MRFSTHVVLVLAYLSIVLFSVKICTAQTKEMPKKSDLPMVIRDTNLYKNTTNVDTNKQMVALQHFLTPLITDFCYATTDNFTHKVLYEQPIAYLRLPAARALQSVQNELKTIGLSLKIFDAYRPYSVTVEMWKSVPDERYAANPAKGSGHNRGAAVDVTLTNLTSKKDVEMPTSFDDFSEKAHHNYRHLNKKVLTNRALLRRVMEKYGFVALETEWWHYSFPAATGNFELMDIDFPTMKMLAR